MYKINIIPDLIIALSIFTFSLPNIAMGQTNSSYAFSTGYLEKISSENQNTVEYRNQEKDYWLSSAEVFGLNVGVWGFSRYVLDADHAKIGIKSIDNNIRKGFEWDEDGYLTNQFSHPYHGAAYFNSARANGLDFWESVPYAFGGSLMWEYFMENERPSYNDIVNTPITGIILGEISYRVSNLIIDESSSGFERFLREFSSTVVNPMGGFNRIIKGKMWQSGRAPNRPDYQLEFSTGTHHVFFDNNFESSKTYIALRFNLDYGRQFKSAPSRKPFDYFKLHNEINLAEDDIIVGIMASGLLWSKRLNMFGNRQNLFGVYKEVDIFINSLYKLSATNLTGALDNVIKLAPNLKMKTTVGLSAVLMGATNSKYAPEDDKEYNIGPGASGKVGAEFLVKDKLGAFAKYKRYWIHTLSGADSEEFVGLFQFGLKYSFTEHTAVGLGLLMYERYGDYKNYPNYLSSNSAIRIYLGQSI